jgi:hypothetical protein
LVISGERTYNAQDDKEVIGVRVTRAILTA